MKTLPCLDRSASGGASGIGGSASGLCVSSGSNSGSSSGVSLGRPCGTLMGAAADGAVKHNSTSNSVKDRKNLLLLISQGRMACFAGKNIFSDTVQPYS